MKGAGYTPPPTQRDKDQSVVHHQNSLAYNLAHARAHATEALSHAEALQDRLAKSPDFKTHYDRLGREGGNAGRGHAMPAEETPEEPRTPPRAEAAEARAAKRGMSPARAERMERRLARGMGR